jgi:hypothetical protein
MLECDSDSDFLYSDSDVRKSPLNLIHSNTEISSEIFLDLDPEEGFYLKILIKGFDDIEIPNNLRFNTDLFDDLEIPDAETLISRLHSKNVKQIPSSLNEIEYQHGNINSNTEISSELDPEEGFSNYKSKDLMILKSRIIYN